MSRREGLLSRIASYFTRRKYAQHIDHSKRNHSINHVSATIDRRGRIHYEYYQKNSDGSVVTDLANADKVGKLMARSAAEMIRRRSGGSYTLEAEAWD